VNHGVDTRLLEDVQREARQFFALPDDEKAQVAMIHSPHFRGYNRAAAELTRGKPDWREQFDIGAERPALALSANAPSWRRLQGPNLWPAAQPSLRPTLLRFQRDMAQMALRLLRALAQTLQLSPDSGFLHFAFLSKGSGDQLVAFAQHVAVVTFGDIRVRAQAAF